MLYYLSKMFLYYPRVSMSTICHHFHIIFRVAIQNLEFNKPEKFLPKTAANNSDHSQLGIYKSEVPYLKLKQLLRYIFETNFNFQMILRI